MLILPIFEHVLLCYTIHLTVIMISKIIIETLFQNTKSTQESMCVLVNIAIHTVHVQVYVQVCMYHVCMYAFTHV